MQHPPAKTVRPARKAIRVGSREIPLFAVVVALLLLCCIDVWVVVLFWNWRPNESFVRKLNSETDAKVHFVDLDSHFNDSLDTGWQHQLMRGNNLGTLPRGRQVFGGVEFDVRGIVQLTSPQLRRYRTTVAFPDQVQGIAIGRKCARLHFLHATGWSVPAGTWIGSYIIHYSDNHEEVIPILYGRDAGNWWANPADIASPSGDVVWQGTNAASQAVQLFKQSWRNPRPEMEIRSLDFLSKMTRSAPFLIGITVEP